MNDCFNTNIYQNCPRLILEIILTGLLKRYILNTNNYKHYYTENSFDKFYEI